MDFLYQLSSFVCHQIPERTLIINDHLLPLCARCTGIYSGFVIGIIFQVLFLRKINRLPSARVFSVLLTTIIILFIDGVGETLHLWNLSNPIRLLFGLLCGSSLSLILWPLFNHFIAETVKVSSINWEHYIAVVLLVGSLYLTHYSSISYLFFYCLSITGLIVMYSLVNLTLAGMIFSTMKKNSNVNHSIMIIVLSAVFLAGEGALLSILHY